MAGTWGLGDEIRGNQVCGGDGIYLAKEAFTPIEFKRWVESRPVGDINRYEFASGRIVMTPPASWERAGDRSQNNRILGEFVLTHRLGKFFGSSARYQLPSGDTFKPDASFVSRERWTKGPQPRRGQFLRLVPSLTVEILSPATAQRDRIEKKKIYETNGVNEYWLVDTLRREITIFHLAAGEIR